MSVDNIDRVNVETPINFEQNEANGNIVTVDGDVCISAIISQLHNITNRYHNSSSSSDDSDSDSDHCNCFDCSRFNGVYMEYLISFLESNGINANPMDEEFKNLYIRLLNNIYGIQNEIRMRPPPPNPRPSQMSLNQGNRSTRQNGSTPDPSISNSSSPRNAGQIPSPRDRVRIPSPRNANPIRRRIEPIEFDTSSDSDDELFDYYDEPRVLDIEKLNELKKRTMSYSEVRKRLNVKVYVDDCSVCITNMKPKYGTYKIKQFIVLDCNHVFHEECIIPYLEKYGRSCPNCREPVV